MLRGFRLSGARGPSSTGCRWGPAEPGLRWSCRSRRSSGRFYSGWRIPPSPRQTQKVVRRSASLSGNGTPPAKSQIWALVRPATYAWTTTARVMILIPLGRAQWTKSRQPFDLDGPAIGPPAVKQDGVYRIFQPKGQTQIVRTENAANLAALMAGQSHDLAPSVSSSVSGLDDPGRLARTDRGGRFLEPRDKHAFAPGKTQLVQTTPNQQIFNGIRQICGWRQLGLGRPREQIFLVAVSTEARSAATHRPRPGSLRPRSGATEPSGPATKRIRRDSSMTWWVTRSRRSLSDVASRKLMNGPGTHHESRDFSRSSAKTSASPFSRSACSRPSPSAASPSSMTSPSTASPSPKTSSA